MCCRAAHPIAQDAQGRWGVVGWDPGCCSSAAAVELTGFRTWTPTPSFASSKGTKSAMLILRGSRRFWARPSFHGTMEWGTGAKLTRPRRCRANLMPSFDVEFLHLVGAWRQFAFAGLSRELPVRRSSRTNEENLARLRAFLCQDSAVLPVPHLHLSSFRESCPIGSRPLQLKAGSLARRRWKVCLLKLGSSA